MMPTVSWPTTVMIALFMGLPRSKPITASSVKYMERA